MKLKTIQILRRIFSPFIFVYFSGFIACSKWQSNVNSIHLRYIKEGKTDIQFAQRMFIEYFATVFLGLLNSFSWCFTVYLLLNNN